MFKRFAEANKL